jgi:type IV pilus assembly protein PilA
MGKLNNKGFTLVEMLAVVVILSVLMAITVPTISGLIEKNKSDSYKSLEKSILAAAKVYISDNRYNITLSGSCGDTRSISEIDNNDDMFIGSEKEKLKIKALVDSGDLNDGNDVIIYPKDNSKKLDLDSSYVIVKYNCDTKDYSYELEENSLEWISK